MGTGIFLAVSLAKELFEASQIMAGYAIYVISLSSFPTDLSSNGIVKQLNYQSRLWHVVVDF